MHSSSITPEQALALLRSGNQRFTQNAVTHPNQGSQRREEVVAGQHPVAAVLSCADSRVPVEILFDQGIGDLFIIRNAGNVVDDVVLASLEYALDHLGVSLVIVLGHTRCGAVTAAVQGGHASGHLPAILEPISLSVRASADQPGDPVYNATLANIHQMVKIIRSSQPVIGPAVEHGALQVVGACYHLVDGHVEFLQV